MSVSDPNREQLVRVARALGDFRSEVVFVGGATLGLLVSDPAAPTVRPTDDVDVVVEVVSYVDYEMSVAVSLRELGFAVCTDPAAPICAWELDGIQNPTRLVSYFPCSSASRTVSNADRSHR